MINLSPELMDIDFDDWQSNRVSLSPAEVDWAVQICEPILDDDQQWHTFLRAMALRGFCSWLEARAVALQARWDSTQPPDLGIDCQVNGFRLCLLAMGSLSDEVVKIPQSALEGNDPAHLYVLIEVQEEIDQVAILGGLRQDQLRAYQQQASPALNPDGTYTVPVRLFDSTPEQVLLYLSCLNPAMIDPVAETPRARVPNLNFSQVINVGRWLRDELDAVADSLSWVLLPPLAAEPSLMPLRSNEELEPILAELEPRGVQVPGQARAAYLDLQSQGFPCRLYALIWPLLGVETPEWSLFLLVVPVPGEQLPLGLRLTIQDADSVLTEQTVSAESAATRLYAQVFGTWDEAFTAAIALPNHPPLPLPPFVFNPDV
jgi:hypothetical protein